MRIKPLTVEGRIGIPLKLEDVIDADVYEDVWLPLGDNIESDLNRLREQIKSRNI